ncbi:MAG: DUF4197 domain-containing protein [Burkholderiales bacterium]|nr:DUF4197 domain-containing protein [Burkholderiales bacterium]
MLRRSFLLFPVLLCTLPAAGATLAELRDSEVASALRQALDVGVNKAVSTLGQENGFLGNDAVRIPMPESLQRAEGLLRSVGLGKQADELVTTMNRAAEQAVPEARQLLANAARKLTVADAKQILTGPSDAATTYFRQHSEAQLVERFRPIVARETKRLKLADYYNRFANRGVSLGLIREEDANLDDYVTRKALDGLFVTLAQEEANIRANPVEAGKRLVTKVFGSLLPE